jgi:uncharacterized RDD family membrane protein YckC
MTSKSFRTAILVCVSFVATAAAIVSAHEAVREAQSTMTSLDRAVSIVRAVVVRERGIQRRLHLTPGPSAVQERPAENATLPAPPQAPASPDTPAAPQAPARRTRPAVPPAVPAAPPAPAPPAPEVESVPMTRGQPVVRVGQGYTVKLGETVGDVVIVGGALRIEGRVAGNVVVVLGSVELASTAVVDGDFVNAGGGMTVESGARVGHDLVTVGGALSAPADFSPRGNQVVVGSSGIGDRVRSALPWVTHGLLLGRPIVPGLRGMWILVGIVLLLFLVLTLIFDAGVRMCVEVIAAKPLTTLLMGLLVFLLIGPISFLLAVSIVGILVLPFLACALIVASVLGQVAVLRWIGGSVVPESEPVSRAQAVRSFAIGFVIVTLVYMVPVLGIITWVMIAVLGLGGATSTLFKALRQENPGAPKPPAASVPPPAPPTHPAPVAPDAAGGGGAHLAADVPIVAAATASAAPSPPRTMDPTAFELLALPRATLSQRLAAGGLDALLVLIVFQLMAVNSREMFWYLLLFTAYNAAFWTWRGTTIGGLICQLRVVRVDGQPLVFGDSLIRGLSSLFSLLVVGLGFWWIRSSGNHDRQAWHDIIAGTVVVRLPRSAPLR